jgi:hypothetical protein
MTADVRPTQSISNRSPLLRFLRGERAAPSRWRGAIDAAGLPGEVRMLVTRVVRRAGGSNAERVDTARELIAHFTDAIAAGSSADESVRAFGDERLAARLLRRAIWRKRTLLRKGWWWSTRAVAAGFAVLLLGYAWLAARFFLATPTIAVDYTAKVKALAADDLGVPPAWPLYREALIALKPIERRSLVNHQAGAVDEEHPLSSEDPTKLSWADASVALGEAKTHLALIREGAKRRSLGVRMGEFHPDDAALFGDNAYRQLVDSATKNTELSATLLPHLSPIRLASRWLACDALHAAHDGDGERAVADIDAIIGIAQHARGSFLIEQLVANAIAALAFQTAFTAIERWPTSFDATRAGNLAAAIAHLPRESARLRFEAERYYLEDVLQRMYTDDGAGDGRLTSAALDLLGWAPEDDRVRLIAPAGTLFAPSRRELRTWSLQQIDLAERIADVEPWRWSDLLARREAISDPFPGAHAWDLSLLRPEDLTPDAGLAKASARAVLTGFRQELTLTVIAMHRHHLERGAWPERLEGLVPTYLPAVPRDPFDGQPLRYAVRDGSPRIWSVGPDRKDDSLRFPIHSRWLYFALETPDAPRTGMPTGDETDVQLWPSLPEIDANGS